MISNGFDLAKTQENEPTNETMSIISPEEARILFGTSAALLDGVSVSIIPHPFLLELTER